MIRVDLQKWGQSLEDLRRLAIRAEHPRTRERFLALSLIADGTHNATTWAARFPPFGSVSTAVQREVSDFFRPNPSNLNNPSANRVSTFRCDTTSPGIAVVSAAIASSLICVIPRSSSRS